MLSRIYYEHTAKRRVFINEKSSIKSSITYSQLTSEFCCANMKPYKIKGAEQGEIFSSNKTTIAHHERVKDDKTTIFYCFASAASSTCACSSSFSSSSSRCPPKSSVNHPKHRRPYQFSPNK